MKLRYFFDFLSPYSYLSWQWVREQIALKEHTFELIPVVLGQIIGHHETKGPAQIPVKRDYLFKDCLRFSHRNNIPFTMPKHLPFNSLYALRMALSIVAKGDQVKVIDTIFSAGWGRGLDIGDPDILKAELNSVGLDGDFYLDQTSAKEARKELKINVKEAISLGLFGLPSFLCNDELFWGNDSIPLLEEYLKGNDYYDKAAFNHFRDSFKEMN